MTVKEIVAEYLNANGYDGLAGEDCGCFLKDLCPCGGESDVLRCVPGRTVPAKPEDEEWVWQESDRAVADVTKAEAAELWAKNKEATT